MGEQVELLGEQGQLSRNQQKGSREVKTKAFLFVGTKELKGVVRNE